MAEFINFQVGVEEDDSEEENEVSDDSDLGSFFRFLLTMKRQKITLIFTVILTMLKLILSKH